MSHMCEDFQEELYAINIATSEGVAWENTTYEEREAYRMRACSEQEQAK